MARPRKYIVKLTEDEYKELKSIIRKKATSKTICCRCQIILDLDESHGKVLTHEQSVNAVTEFKRSINSDNARRKVDGCVEARLIELACGPVPEGHFRWTIRLLEEEARVILETPVSREAIRNALKKQVSTSQKRLLVHPGKRSPGIYSLYGGYP